MPNTSRLRAGFLFVAVGCAVAAVFPDIALLPLRSTISQMRSPDTAVPLARGLFGAAATVFGLAAAAWHWLGAAARGAVTGIAALPTWRFWLLACVVAVLPRLLVAIGIDYQPTSDAAWYHEAAAALAAGQGLAINGELTAYRAPGYPLLLALTYRLFGPDVALAWVWGTLSLAIIVGATYIIAARLYGTTVARLATLLTAAYPALVLMTGQALSDLPFVAGVMSLVAFAVLGALYRAFGAILIGVALGLLTLTRGAAIGLDYSP